MGQRGVATLSFARSIHSDVPRHLDFFDIPNVNRLLNTNGRSEILYQALTQGKIRLQSQKASMALTAAVFLSPS